jgi:formate-dependent nitrite reductase membrane component NrfD
MGTHTVQNSRSAARSSQHEESSLGERLSLWIDQDETRELIAEMLSDFQIVNVHRELVELDNHLVDLEYQREAMRRSLARARRQIALAIYPWLVLAPLALMIAVQTRTSIKRSRPAGESGD